MESGWINPQRGLMELYQLPHNINGLVNNLNNQLYISQQKAKDIGQLVGANARKIDFTGPHLFIGAEYGGQSKQDRSWWLDAASILALDEDTHALGKRDLTPYVDEVVEHCLSYFSQFGAVHNIRTLCLPKGQSILGIVRASRLAQFSPLLARSSERIYFPLAHPEWIKEHPQY